MPPLNTSLESYRPLSPGVFRPLPLGGIVLRTNVGFKAGPTICSIRPGLSKNQSSAVIKPGLFLEAWFWVCVGGQSLTGRPWFNFLSRQSCNREGIDEVQSLLQWKTTLKRRWIANCAVLQMIQSQLVLESCKNLQNLTLSHCKSASSKSDLSKQWKLS